MDAHNRQENNQKFKAGKKEIKRRAKLADNSKGMHVMATTAAHHLGSGHHVARNRGIWGHFDHTAGAAAAVFITFNIAIIGIQESEDGPGAQSVAALNGANHQICASRRVIDGEGGAVESVRGSSFDALQMRRHSAAVRKRELGGGTRSRGSALHREAARGILDRLNRLSTR